MKITVTTANVDEKEFIVDVGSYFLLLTVLSKQHGIPRGFTDILYVVGNGEATKVADQSSFEQFVNSGQTDLFIIMMPPTTPPNRMTRPASTNAPRRLSKHRRPTVLSGSEDSD